MERRVVVDGQEELAEENSCEEESGALRLGERPVLRTSH